ncbi:hypothetical protein AB0L88_17660 [Saccharopolyspora shandongensis]|uniref:hypothetical protein n=1 Tax=Saccharopolyspora shandongensis TaxID=418495 RepID=UPI00344207AC
MDQDKTHQAPASLDAAQASCLFIGYQTGWFGLHQLARIQPGETLLVHAAAGGVGSTAIQLGKSITASMDGQPPPSSSWVTARRWGAWWRNLPDSVGSHVGSTAAQGQARQELSTS